MSYIAPYITRAEYECPCCHELPPDLTTARFVYDILFGKFKEIREEWGQPLLISSGYRCKRHNAECDGKGLSAHLFGLALDINLPSAPDVVRLATLIELLHPDLRRGTYTQSWSFIHIDAAYLIEPRATADWAKGVRWSG
jgi:hypothetical protein